MTFLSLFAGIGGIDLGLERAGMRCVGQVEIDPFCRRVLAKHWPDVWRWDDVTTLSSEKVREHCGKIDLIAGGFPCQDISNAGSRAGIDGTRSGLWSQFHRLIRTLRPEYALVENVAALLNRGIERVLGDLAACGYDAEWDCLPAAAFGAEHFRDRLFLVAYPVRPRLPVGREAGTYGEDARIFTARARLASGFAKPRLDARGHGRWGGKLHGVPRRMDRIRALGNAVVPQVAEWVGRRIVAAKAGVAC